MTGRTGIGKSKRTAAPKRKGSTSTRTVARDLETRIAELTDINRQQKRKIFDLYTIFEISRDFNAQLDYEMLLDTFLLTSLAQLTSSKGAIFLKRSYGTERITIAKRRGSGAFPDETVGIHERGRLAAFLSSQNRPIPTEELMGAGLDDEEITLLTYFHPGLAAPLLYQGSLRGVFCICEKVSSRDFTADDREFLSILTSQISVAIENARLYEAEKLTAQQLRSAQQQLVHSERLAALGEMSAKVAHEINNPLGIIKNYLLLMRRAAGKNEEAIGYVDIVGQEINRIAGIVRELLTFHRPKRLEFQRVELHGLLENVLTLMERQLAKNDILLMRSYDDSITHLFAAPEHLKQLLLNIFINACDAMPSGGTLRLETRKEDDRVAVQICDTGPGIPAEIIPHIFEPFFTTKEPGKGTGLGLSVCYGIVRNHNGQLTFANKPNGGGCFTIVLPIEQKQQPNTNE